MGINRENITINRIFQLLIDCEDISLKENTLAVIEHIVSVLKDAGYNPYEQLFAYASTGNDSYIARKGNARTLIAGVDREQLMQYLITKTSTEP